jgi:hypothetical protein
MRVALVAAARRFVIEFGLYRFLQRAGAKLHGCHHSWQGSEIGHARIPVRHRLPGRVVLSGPAGAARAVVLGLREIAIIGDSPESQAKGGAVCRLSLRLTTVHQE